MMVENGYIKLYRSMTKWGWYDEPNTKAVFLHLLLCANFEDREYRGKRVKPGQAIVGRKKMALELGLSERQVRTALEHLQSSGEIAIESTNKYSVVTIVKWGFFQGYDEPNDQQNDQQPTNNRPTNDQQPTNNRPHNKNDKKEKNVKNDKNVKNIYSDFPLDLKTALDEFIEHRKQIKAPMSEMAVKRMLTHLNELSGGDVQKSIDILNQSIENGWKGIFELKGGTKSRYDFLDNL